jgi:LysM repeat protein
MKRLFILVIFIVGVSLSGNCANLWSLDSLETTTKIGKQFIIHEVEAGETLFALSRRYGVSVQEIKDANDPGLSSLDIGQRVMIPYVRQTIDGNSITHTVKSSETLFSISRAYNVQVDDLKKWNQLADNNISIGQKLVIKSDRSPSAGENTRQLVPPNAKTHTVEESQTLYSISRMYGVSTEDLRAWNNLGSNSLNIGQVLIVSSPGTQKTETTSNSSMLPAEERTIQPKAVDRSGEQLSESANKVPKVEPVIVPPAVVKEEKVDDKIEAPAEKVVQRGLADVIENSADTKKYLAMHRDAPIGTIMQVKNEMNNQTVFVRIVGGIPGTGDNNKVILKISKKAYDRLGAVDSRFPVELSYIP